MSIRTKLLINVLLLVCSLVITGIVLNIARDKVRNAVATGALADQIVIGVSDMNTVTYDYLMKPGGRARQQWEMKHASLDDLIRGARFEGEKESVILTRIMKSHDDTTLFFKQLVENSEKKKHSAAAMRMLLDENDERSVTQLMARSQIMASDAYALSQESDASIQKTLTWSVWFITVTLLIMIVIAGAISYFLSRNITASIKTLKSGTEIIARGDLGHRINLSSRDEIGELARAFDRMSEQLQETTASRDDLAREVLERKRAEAETERLATFPRLNPSPIVETDMAGNIQFVNPVAEMLFPDLRERGLAHPWLADWEALVRTCHEGGTECSVREVTYEGRWYLQTIHFVREFERIRIYGLDITERRTAEMELKERTVQLEAANKELEGFSYSVSHDLRAPLRAIDGFSLRLIRDFGDKLEEDGVRKLHAISRNAQQMGQLIDDLLSFSRLSRKEMHMSRVNMEAMARDVWSEIKESNPNRELDFRIVNMIPVFGDASLIKQVIINLLANAVKFTRGRKPAVIEIGSRNEGSEITYYVKDNGAGFDMRYSDKLFGVFERLHRPDEFEGTGVGLAIVQRIIHRHGGRIWAEGKVDGGATFYFTIAGKEKAIA
jgi:signal transduction histidine kinase/HAMP domain-containing protein